MELLSRVGESQEALLVYENYGAEQTLRKLARIGDEGLRENFRAAYLR